MLKFSFTQVCSNYELDKDSPIEKEIEVLNTQFEYIFKAIIDPDLEMIYFYARYRLTSGNTVYFTIFKINYDLKIIK